MRTEDHTRAKHLLAAERVEGISAEDRRWLDAHLGACDECPNEAAALGASIAALRSVNFMVPDDLVRRTKLAVRRQAEVLESRRETAMPIWIAVAMATAWAILLAPYVWSLFARVGRTLQFTDAVWQTGFLIWWFLPATVLAAVAAWRSKWEDCRHGL